MKALLGDQVVDAQEVAVVSASEPWVEYKLADGTVIRLRIILKRVYRTEFHKEDGSPIYGWESQVLSAITSPDYLHFLPGQPAPQEPEQPQPQLVH